ncbi:MAG: hypothetical protein PHI37_05470 [Candidatus Gracilibacteria bacterium]|nr:hypothetical protein [Candidatus Gracilibacteria bacterium]
MGILITFILVIILGLNIFVYLLSNKIKILEENIINIFKKRNNQIVSIYQISKKYINKPDEVFKTFFDLKRKDFIDNNINFDNKLLIYKEIHNEINFIFKICEQNKKLTLDEKYLYIKDSIFDKSNDIGKNIELYYKIKKEFNNYKKLSNITFLGIFIK